MSLSLSFCFVLVNSRIQNFPQMPIKEKWWLKTQQVSMFIIIRAIKKESL